MKINNRLLYKTLSAVFLPLGVFMLIPFLLALFQEDVRSLTAFLIPAVLCLLIGGICMLTLKKSKHISSRKMLIRDGYLMVAFGSLMLFLFSAAPYWLCGKGIGFVDGWFMSVSSWTTTGTYSVSTMHLPDALMLWRSMNCWMGGFSMLAVAITIFSKLGINEQGLLSGPSAISKQSTKLTAHFTGTVKILLFFYVAMTAAELIFLSFSDMSFFSALLNTLSNVSTSGMIGISRPSETSYVRIVITVFALLASINFFEYYYVLTRHRVAKNYEVRSYLSIIAAAVIMITADLMLTGRYHNIIKAVRDALTVCVSTSSTSGFASPLASSWPTTSIFILLVLMMIGGCSISAASGIKVTRAVVFWKLIMRGIYKRIHPRSTRAVIVHGHKIPAGKASSITVFIMLFFLIVIVAAVIVSLDNQSLDTTFYAVIASLTNSGAFCGKLASGNYSMFSIPIRFFLSLLMIIGRFGIYPIVVLFSTSFWQEK
ncbi:MAG: TrkH family potassium uptake protein [Eubacterium sp.]